MTAKKVALAERSFEGEAELTQQALRGQILNEWGGFNPVQSKIGDAERQDSGNCLGHDTPFLIGWMEFIANFGALQAGSEIPQGTDADERIIVFVGNTPREVFALPVRDVYPFDPRQAVRERLMRLLSIVSGYVQIRLDVEERVGIAGLQLAQMQAFGS
jgi:hypothetical protein